MTQDRTIVVTNTVAEAMIFNARLRNAIQFLDFAYRKWADTPRGTTGPRCCGKGMSVQSRQTLLETVRAGLATLSKEQSNLVKEVLDATRVEFYIGQLKKTL